MRLLRKAVLLALLVGVVGSAAACGAAPPPAQVPVGQDGFQALTLVVTRDSYSPTSFSVRQGVPVKITFRELGSLTCGNQILFPSDPANPVVVSLTSADDQQVIAFIPSQTGTFPFYCPCNCRQHTGSFTVVP
jgi:plastocyanin domain-containing protein